MKLLETEWDKYREAVIPKNAPQVQLTDMKGAFYAGAWALYTLIMSGLDGGSGETANDLALLAKLDAEMRDFNEREARGEL